MFSNNFEKTILFIEDEIEARKNYSSYLQRYFKTVYEASDGEEALLVYKEKRPDLLIIDINIPKINGLDLLEIIRQEDEKTKALILTAYSSSEYLTKALEFANTKYLVKPVSREDLEQTLKLMLNDTL